MAPRLSAWTVIAGLCLALAGCGALPAAGPTAREITSPPADGVPAGYVVVDVDERVTRIWAAQPRESFRRVFREGGPAPDLRIGIGDSVVVTIWEAGSGGLFSATPMDRSIAAGSRTAAIPEQVVARDGTIQVPYAGRLRVAGLRPAEVEQRIVGALAGKAIEPQAVVTLGQNVSNAVTVNGEVGSGARVPLSPRGYRILDMIALAGGIRAPAHESIVRLTRGRRTVTLAFNAILANPQENIYLRPGDSITVVRAPQTFTAFGSTGRNAAIPFDAAGITLEEALAKAGGLLDISADPGGIFLFRFEPAPLVGELLMGEPLPSAGDVVPVVYRLNMRDAHSFFLARAFPVKDKDILYVASAPSEGLRKFLSLIGTVSSPVITGVRLAQ